METSSTFSSEASEAEHSVDEHFQRGLAKPQWSTVTSCMHHLLTYTDSSIFEVVLNGQNWVKTMPGAPGADWEGISWGQDGVSLTNGARTDPEKHLNQSLYVDNRMWRFSTNTSSKKIISHAMHWSTASTVRFNHSSWNTASCWIENNFHYC